MSGETVGMHRDLRKVLGCFATGVTVITALDAAQQRPVGLTVNSFCSVSLDPALVLWSLSGRSPNRAHFAAGRSHAIHILSVGQRDLARQFATPMPDKFQGVPYELGAQFDAPLLDGCAARLFCETVQVVPAGDHDLILARVQRHELTEHPPLLFARGNYWSLENCSSI